MDYSVGSLSDLITGSITPNKKKVIKKLIVSKNTHISTDSLESPESDDENTATSIENKPKFVTKKKQSLNSGNSNGEAKKVGKKRKSSITDSSSEPKKSKNSENAERRVSLKEKASDKEKKFEEDPELLARTVFVGNLPIGLDTKEINKAFMKFGNVETVRIRGIPVANPKTSKKVAFIKKEFHPERKSVFGFVRFEERESAIKAADANGMVFKDHHLRIHLCDAKEKPDENKAIFVGNLSFYAEEDDLWKTFESCGPISSVRIVRDGKTRIGKGFGYVNFENSDSVTLALEMENVKLKDRELRISICNLNASKKNKNKAKIPKPGKPKSPQKNGKVDGEENVENQSEDGSKKHVQPVNKSFQGTKFIQKKKNKLNKGLLQKKKKSRQIAPK